MNKQKPTITLANVYKRFGDVEAVSDVTLSVNSGEVVGFVGPNGAGKTTTISILMGFIRPTKGTAHILGTEMLPETAHKVHREVGYVAGDMVLPTSLTGSQFLTFEAKQNSRNEKRYDQLVHLLDPVLDRTIKTLSRGNKQKIALIAALQHEPSILILDEPTAGLDPLMQEVFMNAVSHEASRGTTVLMSSHILSEVSTICQRIVFMKAGKFILDKPLSSITSQLGKHIIITTDNTHRLIQYLPSESEIISRTPTELRLVIPSSALKPFLRWLITKDFSNVTIEERNLDDVFHELYLMPKGGKRS